MTRTADEYFELMKGQSVILNPGTPDRHQRPRSSRPLMGIDAIKQEVAAILAKGVDDRGRFLGRLEHAKQMRREAKQRWKVYLQAQLGSGKHRTLTEDSKPTGEFLDDINRWSARIRIYEHEARALNALILEFEAEEREKAVKRQKRRENVWSVEARRRKSKIRKEARQTAASKRV